MTSEKILTYPKIKANRVEPKIISLSKLNLTEKINNQKLNYFRILSIIKNKKKHHKNANIFRNFFVNNNIQYSNDLRSKFIYQNEQSQIALITEPYYGSRNNSYKKLSQYLTFSNSSNKGKLMLKKNLNNETSKKLINKIIKIEEKKEKIRKIEIPYKKQPIEFSKSYKQYLNKIKKFNFYHKYPNSNSEYAHNIRTLFYMDKVKENLKQEKENNDKYLKREKEKIEDEKETRDKVFYPSLDLQKISHQIKVILNKFNQIDEREQFFDKFENRINFLYDNFKPPSIKNNLTKIRYEDIQYDENFNLINRVGNSAINYFSNAKAKIQRERDEKIKFLIEKNKIKNKYGYYKKLYSIVRYNSKEEIEKMIYKNYYIKNDKEDLIQEKNITMDEIFENQNYFENKLEKFEKVTIAPPKLRKFFFDNLNFNFTRKKTNHDLVF